LRRYFPARHTAFSLLRTFKPLPPFKLRFPWCRYTAFIPLYPVGVVGEMWSVYDALPLIRERRLRYVTMPNAANFAFNYHLFLVVSAWKLNRE